MVLRSETPVHDVDLSRYSQAIGCGSEVGPQGLRWTTLWKEVNGARIGRFDIARIGKRIPTKKTERTYRQHRRSFAAVPAVLVDIAEKEGRMDWGFGDNVGIYDNDGAAKFKELTRKKKLQARVRHAAALHKWSAKRAGNVPEGLGVIRSICYVGKAGELLPLASSDALIEELVGPMRCLRADLAVVGDLGSRISPDDDAMLPHALAIILLGAPVISEVAWSLAHVSPKQVPAASVTRYRPLAMELKV